jgi:hypothetical protein
VFEKCWEKIGLTDDGIAKLEEELCRDPLQGDVIKGTGGLRKLRWALPNQGKSGSVRVLYVDFVVFEKIYLIAAYTKNEKDNLSQAERNEIKKLIEGLENELKRKVVR